MENKIIEKYTKLIGESIKSKETEKRDTYKLIKTKLMEFATQKNAPELNESAEVQVLNKMAKELKDELECYKNAGREDSVKEISGQISVVESLLPKAATEDEIKEVIESYIEENGKFTQKEMGLVMKHLKSKLTNVDGKLASTLIRTYF